MRIRRASEADLELMRGLWDAFTAETTFTPYPGSPFTPELVTGHVALVAEEDGEALGTVYANLSAADFGYVFGLYVVPEARRRGVARALMQEVARTIRDEGRPYVVLSVDTDNSPARAFYDRLGFVDAARMLRARVDELAAD